MSNKMPVTEEVRKKRKHAIALARARNYARQFELEKVQAWVDQALCYGPISALQMWKIRSYIGEGNARKISFTRE